LSGLDLDQPVVIEQVGGQVFLRTVQIVLQVAGVLGALVSQVADNHFLADGARELFAQLFLGRSGFATEGSLFRGLEFAAGGVPPRVRSPGCGSEKPSPSRTSLSMTRPPMPVKTFAASSFSLGSVSSTLNFQRGQLILPTISG